MAVLQLERPQAIEANTNKYAQIIARIKQQFPKSGTLKIPQPGYPALIPLKPKEKVLITLDKSIPQDTPPKKIQSEGLKINNGENIKYGKTNPSAHIPSRLRHLLPISNHDLSIYDI